MSWDLRRRPAEQSVAILVPEATPDHVKIIVYNLDVGAGDGDDDGLGDRSGQVGDYAGHAWRCRDRSAAERDHADREFERSRSMDVTFAPHTTTVIELKLVEKGVPYWSRPDLGISADDVKVDGNRMKVTVHSLGAVDAPASKVVLRDKDGQGAGDRECCRR